MPPPGTAEPEMLACEYCCCCCCGGVGVGVVLAEDCKPAQPPLIMTPFRSAVSRSSALDGPSMWRSCSSTVRAEM